MRRTTWALTALIVAVVAAGASYLAFGRRSTPAGGPPPGPSATGTTGPQLPGAQARPPVLAPLTTRRAGPRPAVVAAALQSLQNAPGLGRRLVGEVADLSTGRVLWDDEATLAVPPASNAKLLTAVAALRVLGGNSRLTTAVKRRGNTIWLVGGGDVTLASTGPAARGESAVNTDTGRPESGGAALSYPVPATLTGLARATAHALEKSHTRTVAVRLDGSAETGPETAPGWKPTYFTEGDLAPPSALEVDEGRVAPDSLARVANPALVAGNDFVTDLRRDGATVNGTPVAGAAPSQARTIARVASPPVAALVQEMLTNSDNDVAETLARAVARATGGAGSFAAGSAAVLAADRAAGIDLAGTRLVDGSGLSRADRVSPATLISVLALTASRPDLAPILEGVPVGGFSGTLAGRFRSGPQQIAAGLVRAKTGTLSGVSALSGVAPARGGDLLAFSLIAYRTHSSAMAEPALDRIAAVLTRLR